MPSGIKNTSGSKRRIHGKKRAKDGSRKKPTSVRLLEIESRLVDLELALQQISISVQRTQYLAGQEISPFYGPSLIELLSGAGSTKPPK